jgi:hypothetical protein
VSWLAPFGERRIHSLAEDRGGIASRSPDDRGEDSLAGPLRKSRRLVEKTGGLGDGIGMLWREGPGEPGAHLPKPRRPGGAVGQSPARAEPTTPGAFEYATRLAIHFRVPVLTTVVLVEKSGPRELAYRQSLGGRVVHEWRFDVVRLWEMDPERLLRVGPGAAALVGPAEKTTLPLLARAARKIQRETKGVVQSDLLFILQGLSRRRYTARELAGVIPKETVMASSLWAEAVREGRKEGREKGRREGRRAGREAGRQEGAVADARAFCIELTREHRRAVADRVVPLIKACSDVDRLHEWGLQASRLPDPEFLRLVTEQSGSTPSPAGRRRAPRPSRKAKPKRLR